MEELVVAGDVAPQALRQRRLRADGWLSDQCGPTERRVRLPDSSQEDGDPHPDQCRGGRSDEPLGSFTGGADSKVHQVIRRRISVAGDLVPSNLKGWRFGRGSIPLLLWSLLRLQR